jgi:hypothetical protein
MLHQTTKVHLLTKVYCVVKSLSVQNVLQLTLSTHVDICNYAL